MTRIPVLAIALLLALGVIPAVAQNAYITNSGNNQVTVIATTNNMRTADITGLGAGPGGVAVTPDGSTAYVANGGTDTVSVIAAATDTVVGTITVGSQPFGMAVTPDGSKVYVANSGSNTVSVISTATNQVTATVNVESTPFGLAVTPDGSTVYVANNGSNTVFLISTATNQVVGVITVGSQPFGVAVTPAGDLVYVTNNGANNVSVISTASNLVVGTIAVGSEPEGVAATPAGNLLYVANHDANNVSVISTASNQVVGSIAVGSNPEGLAVTPASDLVYVANHNSDNVSVISTASNQVVDTVAVGSLPVALGNFTGLPPTLTVAVTGNGLVGSTPGGIDCGASSTECVAQFAMGSQVTLIAVANAGSSFAGWSGGGCSGTGTCVVTMSTAQSVTATFSVTPSFMLSVVPAGSGSGTVTSNPSGINCGGTCAASFQSGTQVVLTAAAANGSTFAGWSGAGCSGTGTCTVTMSAAESVAATFTTTTATLTVAEAGTGAGQVTSSPSGINCSAGSNQCAAPFAVGSQVTLTASASAGSSFAGWSGGGCSGTGTCVVTMSAAQSVTATFSVTPSFMLSVVPAGSGSGTVTSSPSGINCGGTCAASFQSGTQVVLTAAAANGSTFAGWSGGGCSGAQTCTVTLAANSTVTASFAANSAGNLTLVAAVLPLSRSVAVGATATAFATIIDAGPADASTCTIAPATGIPANFVFQTTDPTTNALTGTANTPANIAAGQAQSFVIALTPTAAFTPTNVAFTFTCANAPSPAATIVGIDTLNLSASAVPVPDIIALAASADPGFVDIPGATGTGDFAVATVNLGISAQISVAANTGTANLPVTLTLCQTDPTSGACLAAPSAVVVTTIANDATPTFGIFVTGSAAVADLPGVNRVFVTFIDANGVLRGETSVAVRTQ